MLGPLVRRDRHDVKAAITRLCIRVGRQPMVCGIHDSTTLVTANGYKRLICACPGLHLDKSYYLAPANDQIDFSGGDFQRCATIR